jgi:hypothetical protein
MKPNRVIATLAIELLAISGLGLGLTGTSLATTSARTAQSQMRQAIPGPSSVTSAPAGRAPGSKRVVITCKITVANPHHSTHVPETADAVATVKCTGNMSGITMSASLSDYTHNRVGNNEDPCVNSGKQSLSCTAALPCEDGSYQGFGQAEVVFPPDYTPPSENISANSKVLPVTC